MRLLSSVFGATRCPDPRSSCEVKVTAAAMLRFDVINDRGPVLGAIPDGEWLQLVLARLGVAPIREQMRLSRYRSTRSGDVRAADGTVGGEPGGGGKSPSGSGKSGGRGGRKGDIYSLWVDPEGTPAEAVAIDNMPEVDCVTVANGKRTPPDLEDRAGKFLGEQNRLLINGDFRGFQDMIERWYQLPEAASGHANNRARSS